MEPYKELIHGGDVVSAAQAAPAGRLLDFSANINPLGMPEPVRRALARGLNENVRYPDPLCRELRVAIARMEDAPPHWILCGAGAADLIFRLAYGLRPKRALLLSPSFAEYRLALEQAGCECVFHALERSEAFAPRASLAPEAARCDLAVLCNPNNPTGAVIRPNLMAEVLAACRDSGTVLAVDECFLDFLPDPAAHTLKGKLADFPNLIVLRAFTKLFAMPGLRLGYALCSGSELLRRMDEAGPAWNVSVPAQQAGVAAAKESGYVARARALIALERPRLERTLASLGLTVFPSSANYIMFYCPVSGLAQSALRLGALIRDCSNYPGLGSGYYRVAVRTQKENKILARILEECLRGKGVSLL